MPQHPDAKSLKPPTLRERVLALLDDRGPLDAAQIAEALGTPIDTTRSMLSKMASYGQIEVTGARPTMGTPGHPHVYTYGTNNKLKNT